MKKLSITLALAALAAAGSAQAQSDTKPPLTLDEIRALVRQSLPPVLFGSNTELIGLLLKAQVDTQAPFSKTFNPSKVSAAVFGRVQPTRDPQCAQPLTAAGDVDRGLCTALSGDPNGTGALTVFSYGKYLADGSVTILKRPAQKDITPTSLPAVQLSDSAAYQAALKFAISTLGVSQLEVPKLSLDSKLPVTTLTLGYGVDGKQAGQINFMKVVHIQRAALLPTPLRDPSGNQNALSYLLLPGEASFLINDSGIQGARVEHWVSAPIDPDVDPKLAKSADELINEIADDLFAQGGQHIFKLSFAFALSQSAYPNPDDPNSPHCPACLRPVLRVALYTQDTVNTAAGDVAAPGFTQDYQLVDGTENAPARLLAQ